MGLKVRLHRRARADLESIRDYLSRHADAAAAERVRRHLRQKMLGLGERPLIGTATSDPAIRILPPTIFPYRIYCIATDTAVIILHVRHTSRQAPDLDDLR